MNACDACVRRCWLLGRLAPWIARSLDERRKLPLLLKLGDDELIAAVCGNKREKVEAAFATVDADAERERARRAGLIQVCRHDASFPARLLEAEDAPTLLNLRGEVRLLEDLGRERPVALVGSRRASAYGLEVAHALGRDLAACGVPVVSGMAFGVDSAAHEGALAADGPTVAVLGGGADLPYPPSARGLHRRIAAGRGLVMSEMPAGAQPFRWSFPARNRIMAGLAAMTVVVEGRCDSGSLITARFAAALGREVGAVPGQVTSPLAAGPLDLLADGACLVRSAADVIDTVYGLGHGREPARAEVERLEPDLRQLLEAVGAGSEGVDSLAREPGDVPRVVAGLGELELMGLVRRAGGGRYVRCA